MKTDDMILTYGTSGAEMECPNCSSSKFRVELPYPFATLGAIRLIAARHIKKEH